MYGVAAGRSVRRELQPSFSIESYVIPASALIYDWIEWWNYWASRWASRINVKGEIDSSTLIYIEGFYINQNYFSGTKLGLLFTAMNAVDLRACSDSPDLQRGQSSSSGNGNRLRDLRKIEQTSQVGAPNENSGRQQKPPQGYSN